MPVRIIHVGLGGWGGNWARTAIPQVTEVEVVGLVDPVPATLDAVREDLDLPESAAFASLTEALAGVEADAVVITAPAVTHVPLALEALEAGKHVLVEKPFANSTDEALTAVRRAEELIQAAEQEAASGAVLKAQAMLDRAASKGIIHPNNAARRKSRLMAKYNKLVAS